ncbi:hypothetical protein A6S26_03905 [Nostoc sp. ATCC 43529]|nr:hypothetical protein A6S26_03905 [Nostoc sp. ATCC 43529]
MEKIHRFNFKTLSVILLFSLFLIASSTFMADSLQASTKIETQENFSTGDFRLRSYLKETHPKFLSRTRTRNLLMADQNCTAVETGKIYRFLEGIDSCVIAMTQQEIEENLNDQFATNVLREGTFPDSVDKIIQAISNSGLNFQQANYMVGEGGQIPTTIALREAPRNLRYAIAWGTNPTTSAQILLSAAPGGNSSFLQIISWDSKANKYNFYEFREQRSSDMGSTTKVWSWAGDSSMARLPQTIGQGCFDCHHNGVVIMKELAVPWNNWQSQRATISSQVVPLVVANEPIFQNLTGAENLEQIIKGGFQNYYNKWLRKRYQNEGSTVQLSDTNQMLAHVISNTTINFGSTNIQSNGSQTSPPNSDISGIPNDFFLWDSILSTTLGLQYQIPTITFKREDYDNYLKANNFKLVQDQSPRYEQNGSTYFAFFVPVPSAEDTFMVGQLRQQKIISDKFIAALLMVDFKNPVFSEKRTGLQQYADQITTGTITNGVSDVPDKFVALVKSAADKQPACDANNLDSCTAEQQFLQIWNLADDQWKTTVQQQIQNYLNTIAQLSPDEQLDRLMKLSVQRRNQFKSWKYISNLNEFSLLLPQTSLSP